MMEFTPCFLPKFGSATEASQRPTTIRVNLSADDEAHLMSAWREDTLSAAIHVTWGLIVRCHTGSDDVCFGYRFINVFDQPHSAGASLNSINPLTIRLDIGDDDSIKALIKKAKEAAAPGEDYQLYNTAVLVRSYYSGDTRGAVAPATLPDLSLALPQEVDIHL
ncbi:uncharacterized protein BDV17DRAFT_287382 [Aspergillus undulatus]|uniref:uncharacterized protein n=1 Tax=Aspergillus undulatus TaxID=1810928 RepID=UPI003CCDAA9B